MRYQAIPFNSYLKIFCLFSGMVLAKAGLEMIMQLRLASNTRSFCRCLLGVGIAGVWQHAQLPEPFEDSQCQHVA